MRYFYLLPALMLCFNALSQNLKPRNERAFSVTIPPRNQVFMENRRVFIAAHDGYSSQYTAKIFDMINRDHYTIVYSEQEADWKMELDVSSYENSALRQTNETKTSTVKGKPMTTTTWTATAGEKHHVSLKLYQRTGELIQDYRESSKDTYTGTSTTSQQAAYDEYLAQVNRRKPKDIEKVVAESFGKAEADYLVAKRYVYLYAIEIKSKKFDYSDLNEAARLYTEWQSEDHADLSDQRIVRAMQIYTEALTEYVPEQKKMRVNDEIAAVCHYALAAISFSVKDYPKAYSEIITSESIDKNIHFSQEALKQICALLRERRVFF
jgi:hypothetical protein